MMTRVTIVIRAAFVIALLLAAIATMRSARTLEAYQQRLRNAATAGAPSSLVAAAISEGVRLGQLQLVTVALALATISSFRRRPPYRAGKADGS